MPETERVTDAHDIKDLLEALNTRVMSEVGLDDQNPLSPSNFSYAVEAQREMNVLLGIWDKQVKLISNVAPKEEKDGK